MSHLGRRSRDSLARLLAHFANAAPSSPKDRRDQPIVPLTQREEELALTVAQGLSNPEIATALHLSLNTVKFHLGSLRTKLSVRNRVEIVIWAYDTRRVRL